MKDKKKRALRLIAMNRLDTIIKIIIKDLENDKDTKAMVAAIRKRTKSHKIEITRGARNTLIILATKRLREDLKKSIKIIHIKGTATIDEEVIEQGNEIGN